MMSLDYQKLRHQVMMSLDYQKLRHQVMMIRFTTLPKNKTSGDDKMSLDYQKIGDPVMTRCH